MFVSYPSSIFISSFYLGHVITYSRKLPQTVLLPNDGVLPTASFFTESSEEIFLAEWYFVTKLGPHVSLFPVPIFGVNMCPFNYGIKMILFRN
jgi:hypothetical protein